MQVTGSDTAALKIEADTANRQALAERDHVAEIIVTNAEEYRLAAETRKQLSEQHRKLEARRKEATKPLDEAKKAIMNWFRPALDALTESIDALGRQLTTYSAHQARIEAEAAQKASEALRAGQQPDPVQMARAFASAVPTDTAVTIAQVWGFEITDPDAIPREYLAVNEQMIRIVVKAMKDKTNIPGIRVFQTGQARSK